MKLSEQLEQNQLPRRLLGAMLAVLVPGAGHVVIGYTRAGWLVAAATLTAGAGFIASAMTCAMRPLAMCGGILVVGTITSVVSIFALPPGPRLKDGLRALWPVLVLFLVFRGAAYAVPTWAIAGDFAADATMRPHIEQGDFVFSRIGSLDVRIGDVVVVEHPAGTGQRMLRRVAWIENGVVTLRGDVIEPKTDVQIRVPLEAVRGRALFVFAAARGSNGVRRVWRPLRARR